MPEMDGKQVIDTVRKHFKIPIILLSGYSVNATKLQEAAPDRILTKPVTTEKIILVMNELFQK
jgi:CheY-like chemotaxis protein